MLETSTWENSISNIEAFGRSGAAHAESVFFQEDKALKPANW
jgi:hypothetical protein